MIYLHFMFGSTSSRSLKPMPQGFPGVASSMNLPNSGWNTGAGFSFALPWSVQDVQIWTVRLTRRLRFASQVLRRPAAEASHRWPAQLGYQPDGAIVGPCGCPGHSKQPGTRSGRQSVADAATDERMVILHLISPKKGIPLLAFSIAPDSE